MKSRSSVRAGYFAAVLALINACGSTDSESSGKGGSDSGTSGKGGSGGSGALGGNAGSGNAAGTGGIDCSRVGCGPPPQCGEPCSSACGCCPCAEGEKIPLDGGSLVCTGGCYALVSDTDSGAEPCGIGGACIPASGTCPTGTIQTQMGCPLNGHLGSCCIAVQDSG